MHLPIYIYMTNFGYNKEESTWEGNIYYMLKKNKCVAELSSRVLLSLFDIFIKTKLQYLLSHFFDHERKKEIPHIFHYNKGL